MEIKVSILTCVSNAWGLGPGHTAIVVGNDVFSFEELAGTSGDSWLIIRLAPYLERNVHRPVLVQELKEVVEPRRVLAYIASSIRSDDDYIGSGVCSSQVASALEAGLGKPFNPTSVDTPWKVFQKAVQLGIVRRTYYYWPGRGSLSPTVRQRLDDRLRVDYPNVTDPAPADGIHANVQPAPPAPPIPTQPQDEIVPVIPRKTTLSGISLEKYKTYELWPLIWDRNRSAIGDNPNRLQNVTQLRVRALSAYSATEIADAKKRAPTWKNYPA